MLKDRMIATLGETQLLLPGLLTGGLARERSRASSAEALSEMTGWRAKLASADKER